MDQEHKEKYVLLGRNIAFYRKIQGLTQFELAQQTHLDRTSIAKLETATVGATLDSIFAISDALQIPPSKLFQFER